MSDRLLPLPIDALWQQIMNGLNNGQVFGIYQSQFFQPKLSDPFRMKLFGQTLATPIGPAAGPHTQMAQNIVSAWLCGSRYIELKTVQTLDKIEVSKPCIDMEDEGYNCEWSQELTIRESFGEYLKAWILIHIIKKELKFDGELDTIFNMSVGYNLAGIHKPNVQWFFDKMTDASEDIEWMKMRLAPIYPAIEGIDIPSRISNNITLSTMHGCPADEIEQIGKYLLEERKLHTLIKLNPTLLGKDTIHQILNNSLGYQTVVPDEAFKHDISYDAAKDVIQSLQKSAEKMEVTFGVKLTNTLEALNHRGIFSDSAMYMSGKALHPISINVAKMIRNDFPDLLSSFSAGVNALNINDVLACGLSPATTCSDLLKPGGYARLGQYIENLRKPTLHKIADSIEYLNNYAENVLTSHFYSAQDGNIKTSRPLGDFDCIAAPCEGACPTHQQIPDYLYYTAQNNIPKAFETILNTNPFPAVTGMVCDHQCQSKCTRRNYDDVLLIRDIKRYIVENTSHEALQSIQKNNGHRVGIIGAGPSGLSAAWFLKMAGFSVDVYESKTFPGGMLADAIPQFRLSDQALNRDIKRIRDIGVNIHTSTPVNKQKFSQIQQTANYIYLAVGAQSALKANIPGDNAKGVLDPLEFLSNIRQGKQINIGEKIIILGGGNTAIDAARTALRVAGKKNQVTILYRRSRKEMPADADEIEAALAEGIQLIELASPSEILAENNRVIGLRCNRMKLGKKDNSGRAQPIPIENSEFILEADTIIPAFGQALSIDFIEKHLLKIQNKSTRETSIPNLFIGGDAYRGASTIISAVADGRFTAETIIRKALGDKAVKTLEHANKKLTREVLHHKKSRREPRVVSLHPQPLAFDTITLTETGLTKEEAIAEANRCLYCDELCDVCVTVCPNRAFHAYELTPFSKTIHKATRYNGHTKIVEDGEFHITQSYQVFNIEDFCNECGNCATFCPTNGAPYKDKPRVALSRKALDHLENGYYREGHTILYKENTRLHSLKLNGNTFHYTTEGIEATLNSNLDIQSISMNGTLDEWHSDIVFRMKIIGDELKHLTAKKAD